MQPLFLKMLHRKMPAGSAVPAAFASRLHLKRARKWTAALCILVCAGIAAACSANTGTVPEPEEPGSLYGDYAFEKQVYMNPLSSFIAFEGYEEYYTLTEDSLILTDQSGNRQTIQVAYEQAPLDEGQFADSFIMESIGVPDISSYKQKNQYTLTDASGAAVYQIYLLDEEIWLARIHEDTVNTQKNQYIWSIYQITKLEGEIPVKPAAS